MNKEGFVHLTTQSSFTPGALGNIQDYARVSHIFGMPALGLADKDHLEALTVHEHACQTHDIKPIFGLTVYPYVDETHRSRVSLVVRDTEGFHSLYRLNEKGSGLTLEDMMALSQGLLAIAPSQSYLPLRSGLDREQLFFEYTYRDDPGSRTRLASEMQRAQSMNANVVATNRVWRSTPRTDDQLLSLALLANRSKKKLDLADFPKGSIDTNRTVYQYIRSKSAPGNLMERATAFHPEGWLKPPAMMRSLLRPSDPHFDEWQLACDNTLVIAQACKPEALPNATLPAYPVPEGETVDTVLYKRALNGLQARYQKITPQIRDRLLHELNVVGNRGLASLFLIVDDIVRFAKAEVEHEAVGSATDSLLSYVLGVSNVDPIAHDLPVERFLGPPGTILPDIDIQVDSERRGLLYDFMFEHFPEHGIYPAHIATYPTYGTNKALSTVLSTFGFTQKQIKEIRQRLKDNEIRPTDQSITLSDGSALPSPILKAADMLAQKNLYQGHVNKHPSKVIFFDAPVEESRYPVAKYVDNQPVVPIDKDRVKERCEMEFDTVSSARLALLRRMLDIHGMKKEDIPRENPEVLQELFKAYSIGIPDVETRWLRQILFKYGQKKRWQNLSEGDLSVAFALSRPGVGDEYRNLFYAELQKKEPYLYGNVLIDQILEESMGVAVFQEQIMLMAQAIGGFNAEEADAVRRQISKGRDARKLDAIARRFRTGAIAHGIALEKADMLVGQLMHFSQYGFVKGHAISLMSNIAYPLAYLKHLDPVRFIQEVKALKKGHYIRQGHPEAYDDEIERVESHSSPKQKTP